MYIKKYVIKMWSDGNLFGILMRPVGSRIVVTVVFSANDR